VQQGNIVKQQVISVFFLGLLFDPENCGYIFTRNAG
jgi:hypothetical protein